VPIDPVLGELDPAFGDDLALVGEASWALMLTLPAGVWCSFAARARGVRGADPPDIASTGPALMASTTRER
jgi:hypothetical protein